MSRIQSWTLMAGVFGVLGLAAMAAPSAANSIAAGSGHLRYEDSRPATFSFNVVRKADGTVTGRVINLLPGFLQYQLSVDCAVEHDDHTVILSGTVVRSTFPDAVPLGETVTMAVQDNGEGGQAPADRFSGPALLGPGVDCTNLAEVLDGWGISVDDFMIDLDGGNIQVWPGR